MGERPKVTLVCGGGGVWGVAWMTGLIAGLADAGLDVRRAAAFIGTSAGSVIAAQMSSPLATEDLFARQTDPARQPREPGPPHSSMAGMMALMQRKWRDERERLEATRQCALAAETMSVAERRGNIVERLGLPADVWPEAPVSITAVDLETLEPCVFTRESGVSLVDAVSASCSVPGVWPPAVVNGRRYLDGGVWRTAENAHLAAGAAAVLILSPMGRVALTALGGGEGLAADVARLEAGGARVAVIAADEAAIRAMAPNPLDAATRKPAAEAGRLQGRREVAEAARVFGAG
jgi:NTE family protein